VRRRQLQEEPLVSVPRPGPPRRGPAALLAGAGNRAISALIASQAPPQVQREEDDDVEESGEGGVLESDAEGEQAPPAEEQAATAEEATEEQEASTSSDGASTELDDTASGDTEAGDSVTEVCQAIAGTVDPAVVTDGFRQDGASLGGDQGAADGGTEVQALATGNGVQRDTPPSPPAPPRAADASDILDAVLALKAISDLIDRISDLAIKQIKKAGAPATIVLGVVALPPLIAGLNQGAGVTKLVLKTPQIDLGTDRQGVKRSIQFRLEIKVDPTTGGAATLGAAVTF